MLFATHPYLARYCGPCDAFSERYSDGFSPEKWSELSHKMTAVADAAPTPDVLHLKWTSRESVRCSGKAELQ